MASTSKTSLKTTAYLKTIIGNSVGEIFPLTSGEITIGRNRQSAQICIRDPNVSRSHCVLKYSENGWFIKDLESVNGTFLDGKMLETQKFYPLKDGAGIYLGPPGEAPSAFIFLTKMPNEQFHEANVKSCSQKSRRRNTHIPVFVSNKNGNKSMKRPSDSESSNVNGGFSQRKRKAAASSSSATPTVQGRDILDEIEDVDNLSDCSISSLDSLRTRLRKMSARKKNNRNTRKRGIRNAASSSASPHLKPLSNASLASQPSTSATPVEMLESKTHKSQEPSISKEFALLNTIFNESESSTLETIKGEDSESLLNDSKMLIDCEPYPFSQQLLTDTPKKGRNKYEKKAQPDKENSLKEQLKKATLELKKLKDDKLHLSRLVEELKSEEFLKNRIQDEFQKILEDELMCNICTEIFMKAVTLGCSHTFCEHCISEWKKKQKKCPICREKIASETNILVLDSFINKAVDHLDAETQKRRKELLASREKAKAAKQKKKNKRTRGRGRRIRSDSSEAEEVRQLHGESSNSIGVQIRFSGNSSPSIQVIREDDIVGRIRSDISDLSDISDISIDGLGFFGENGRCYNCGRRGHWANGCPF